MTKSCRNVNELFSNSAVFVNMVLFSCSMASFKMCHIITGVKRHVRKQTP